MPQPETYYYIKNREFMKKYEARFNTPKYTPKEYHFLCFVFTL